MNRSTFTNEKSKEIIAKHGSKVMGCESPSLLSLLETCMGTDFCFASRADIRLYGEGERPRLHLAIDGRSDEALVIDRARRRGRSVIEVLAAAFNLDNHEPEGLEILQGLMMLAVGWCKLDAQGDYLVGIRNKLAHWDQTIIGVDSTPDESAVCFLKEACDLQRLFEAVEQASLTVVPKRLFRTVSIDLIDLDEGNFRSDLGDIDGFAENIKSHGNMHPITVIPKRNGRFDVLLGERRYRAQKKAGCTVIDVIIDSPSADMVTLRRLSENCQSKKNNHLELARAFDMAIQEKRGLDPNFLQKDLAEAVDVDVTLISKYLKLLSIPPKYHDRIRHLGMEHLLIIAGADTDEERQRLIDLALNGATVAKMRSVRQTPATKKKAATFRQKLTHGGINVTLSTKKQALTKPEVQEAFQTIINEMFPEG
jgi:ParB/RepB/Spo0J family partition protein